MNLFCLFYRLEIEPVFEQLIGQTYSLYDRGGNNIQYYLWNYESQMALWQSYLCGS